MIWYFSSIVKIMFTNQSVQLIQQFWTEGSSDTLIDNPARTKLLNGEPSTYLLYNSIHQSESRKHMSMTSKPKQHLVMSSVLVSCFPSHTDKENGGTMMAAILLNAGTQMKFDQNRFKMVSRKAEYYVVITFLILNFKEQYKMERQIFLKIRNYKWSHQQEVFIFKYKLCIFILKVLVTMFTSKILYWAKSSFPLKQTNKKKSATNFPEKGPLPTVNGGRVFKNTVITAIKQNSNQVLE